MKAITKFLNVGKHNHVPDSEFNNQQLEKGIEIEYEHTDSRDVAKAIAKDHLSEDPRYYIFLEEMEKKFD